MPGPHRALRPSCEAVRSARSARSSSESASTATETLTFVVRAVAGRLGRLQLSSKPFLGVGQHLETEQLGERVVERRWTAVEEPAQFVVGQNRPPQFQRACPAEVVGTLDSLFRSSLRPGRSAR